MCACSEETVSLASGRVWIGLWALAARVSQRFMVVSALPGRERIELLVPVLHLHLLDRVI